MKSIGFIGMGAMGYPMAGHLHHKTGRKVMVFNRSPEKATAWQREYGGECARSLQELAQMCDVIMLCVGRDEDVRENVHHLLPHLSKGTVLIDHTTTSADLSREMAALCTNHQISFLDCPVSGGQSGAQQGILTMMCGGDATALEQVRPLLQSYAQKIVHFGSSGQGQICKMGNQILLCGIIQSLSESIAFLEHEHMPIEQVLETLQYGAGGSWQLVHRGATMHQRQFDFGFSIDHMLKDLGLVENQARSNGTRLPVLNMVKHHYELLKEQGFGQLDTSSLIKLL
jgi:3-hydroxyisobutyrate dehydrogenase